MVEGIPLHTLSYNLRKNRAVGELDELVAVHDVDVLCLQEAETVSLPEEIRHMRLVHSTAQNRLGLAMYVRGDRFQVNAVDTFALKKSMHDRLLAPAHERLLGARLFDEKYDREFVAASFHAAPLTATNKLRRHQINAAHQQLERLGPGLPTLMMGDFNYPIFQKRLARTLGQTGHTISRSDSATYRRYGIFGGNYDFVVANKFDVENVLTLPQGLSDHMPIKAHVFREPSKSIMN